MSFNTPIEKVPLFCASPTMELVEAPTRWMFHLALERGRSSRTIKIGRVGRRDAPLRAQDRLRERDTLTVRALVRVVAFARPKLTRTIALTHLASHRPSPVTRLLAGFSREHLRGPGPG